MPAEVFVYVFSQGRDWIQTKLHNFWRSVSRLARVVSQLMLDARIREALWKWENTAAGWPLYEFTCD